MHSHKGNVYQISIKDIKDHPKERIEASFDIVTSSHADCLPEIEILSIVNEIITSFPELVGHNFKLVCNHTLLLRAILCNCAVDAKHHKDIFLLLSEFTSKQNKSYFLHQEDKRKFLADKLMALELPNKAIEKLLHLLLKSGDTKTVTSELRSLTKAESHVNI